MTGILARTEALLLSTLYTGQLHSGVHNCKLTCFHYAYGILFSFVINGKHVMCFIFSKDVIASAGNA